MDGELPSWLDEGPSSSPAPPAAAPAPAADPTPPSAFSIDDETTMPSEGTTAAAGGGGGGTARTPPVTDNVAGSILGNVTKKNSAGAGAGGANSAASAAAAAEADDADLPKVILFMRVLNMAAAVLLVTCSVLQLIGIPHISIWVTAIYASCGGILICCLETQLKLVRTVIAMNFGFLFNSVYRFLFYCLMGSVSWSYPSLLGKITAIVLGVVAVFNTFVLCRYPAYRKMREKIAAEEDGRIQAKINQQVRKQAISQMGWGRN